MTFEEYLAKNHPEILDEVKLPNFLRNAAFPAIAAAGLMGRPEVDAATPDVPTTMDGQNEFSDKPFNRNIGPQPNRYMSDYDLYYWQVRKVSEFLKEREMAMRMGKQITPPMWYIKMGDEYSWKRPRPPKFSEREQAYAKFMNDRNNSEEQKQMMTNLYNNTR